MAYYRKVGKIPPKHLTVLRKPDGRPYYEELFSTAGFSGLSSMVYRIHPSTSVTRIEPAPAPDMGLWDPGVARPHMLSLERLDSKGDFLSSRRPLFLNDDISFSLAHVDRELEGFYRNSYSDELVVVVEGTGRLTTTFGALDCGPLDFVHIPRGTTVQWKPTTARQVLVVLEPRGPVTIPERFRAPGGQLLERAPYHERDLRGVELQDPVDARGEFPILVKGGGALSRYVVDRHPFDVVGWDGYLYPYALNMANLEPISGRVHQMPDLYQVFGAEGAVICAVVPNRVEDHPEAAPRQPYHNNVDYDEIYFRISSLGSPGGKDPRLGKITMNPRLFAHGPLPGWEGEKPRERSDGYGLMVDTTRPLRLARAAQALDDPGFVRAFMTRS